MKLFKNLFKSKKKSTSAGFAPLNDGELAILMAYLLAKDKKSWYGFVHNGKSDAELIIDLVNGETLEVIDYNDVCDTNLKLTRDKLRYGFKKVCKTNLEARKEDEPGWGAVDVYKLDGFQIADLSLQHAIAESHYETGFPRVVHTEENN